MAPKLSLARADTREVKDNFRAAIAPRPGAVVEVAPLVSVKASPTGPFLGSAVLLLGSGVNHG